MKNKKKLKIYKNLSLHTNNFTLLNYSNYNNLILQRLIQKQKKKILKKIKMNKKIIIYTKYQNSNKNQTIKPKTMIFLKKNLKI